MLFLFEKPTASKVQHHSHCLEDTRIKKLPLSQPAPESPYQLIWTSKIYALPVLPDVHKADDWTMTLLIPLLQKKKLPLQPCLSEKQLSRLYMEAFDYWNLYISIIIAATKSGGCDFWFTGPQAVLEAWRRMKWLRCNLLIFHAHLKKKNEHLV